MIYEEFSYIIMLILSSLLLWCNL